MSRHKINKPKRIRPDRTALMKLVEAYRCGHCWSGVPPEIVQRFASGVAWCCTATRCMPTSRPCAWLLVGGA